MIFSSYIYPCIVAGIVGLHCPNVVMAIMHSIDNLIVSLYAEFAYLYL